MINIEQTFEWKRSYAGAQACFSLAMFASEDKPWFEAYKAAILELDAEKLPERIVAANEAVQLRLKEIEGDGDHHAERQDIGDALNALKALKRVK